MHTPHFRTAATMASASLVLAATAGCAVDQPGADAAPYDPDEKVTITFSWWGGEERNQITKKAIEGFEEDHPNITVETQSSDFGSYWDMLATQVAGGDAPDLLTMGGSYPSEYAGRGALLDLATMSDHLDMSKLPPDTLETGNLDGTQYTVPAGVNALATFLNPTVFEEAGVELPDTSTWTWDDYAEISEQLSKASPDGTYGTVPFANSSHLDAWIHQHGESLYTEDGSGVGASPETIASWFQLWLDGQKSGASPGASLFVEDSTAVPEQSLFGTGKAGIIFAWSGFQTDEIGDDIIEANLPGESATPGNRIGASMEYAISSTSEHPEAAAMLLDYLINDERVVDAIGTDRGIPANTELRDHLREDLTPAQQQEVDLLDAITESDAGARRPAPTGASSTGDVVTRLLQDVLFERTTPADAAEQLVSEVESSLK
ncbi:sugar ABC transporter substrate-binding protein [Isoptericola sp. 4D.3]|uniref:Sugar ABC transporter substrate-binding protein n=2 Tax=Isoptericola peretonis TaxID=2918523 RepID=A0ABT0J3J8_9MICO|nr:sugar ABC transporter substrate-binding protein [Isoptericola sp. 4D.3]